jgi:hypothetical protein
VNENCYLAPKKKKVMNSCNTCKDDKPDILRSNICIGSDPCNDCTDNCEILPKECDCPYGHLSDHCIHYTGCKTFISKLTPGMPYNEVMHNIELVFENIDKFLDRMVEENTLLKQRVEQLEKQLQNGKECTNW